MKSEVRVAQGTWRLKIPGRYLEPEEKSKENKV